MLGELEPGADGKGDVVIGRKQGDQGDHDAGEDLESALEIEAAATAERDWCCNQVWRRLRRGLDLRQSPRASRDSV